MLILPGPFGSGLATFAVALAGGLLPFVSIEAYVLAVSLASPDSEALPVALAATLGQMAGKSVVYLAGTGLVRLPWRRANVRIAELGERLARNEGGAMALVLASASVSVPPFYPLSLAAGALRLRFPGFFVAGCAGTFLRFLVLFSLPRLFA